MCQYTVKYLSNGVVEKFSQEQLLEKFDKYLKRELFSIANIRQVTIYTKERGTLLIRKES